MVNQFDWLLMQVARSGNLLAGICIVMLFCLKNVGPIARTWAKKEHDLGLENLKRTATTKVIDC